MSADAKLRDPLFQAKLTVPRQPPGSVSRAKLAALVANQRPWVVAVSAPAGYGKTTLLAEWARQDPRRVAWVSLDRGDNDPVAFVTLLAVAISTLGAVDASVYDELASPGVSVLGRVLPRLLASLASRAEPFLLILDDAQEVGSEECHDALNLLVDGLPPGSTLAAAGRGEVWLNLPRRRARGEVLELGPADLAFDAEETAQLLGRAGVEAGSDLVADLVSRTEGWPAGLYLAALGLREEQSGPRDAQWLSGQGRPLADYLRLEILDRAPTEVRQFLTRTAVLDQLCGPLCDRVLERNRSGALLAGLAGANQFVVPLDHKRQWYRYHRLFRDLLLEELAQNEPELVPELHRRAADWYEAAGRPETAIDHAHAAGDAERGARLVAECGLVAYSSGRLATALQWLEKFGAEQIERLPPLAVQAAWAFAVSGQPEEAKRWANVADRGSFVGTPPDGSASIESARAMLRAAMCPNGAAAMVADAQFAVAEEPPWSPWRGVALILLYAARSLEGEAAEAEAVLAEAVETAEATGGSTLALALTERGILAMDRGQWQMAGPDLAKALTHIDALGHQEYMLSAITFAAAARLALHDQDLQLAKSQLARALRLRLLATWALPWAAVAVRLEVAKVCMALSDWPGAHNMLNEIGDILRRRPDLGVLVPAAEHLRSQLGSVAVGPFSASVLTTAELRLLPYLQTHLLYREIAQRLYISTNTVKTETRSLFRKLGVSTRRGAVERARELGLLAR
jgi:LuxR family transcriptional regulator, maltose regulon positive regulatory protein